MTARHVPLHVARSIAAALLVAGAAAAHAVTYTNEFGEYTVRTTVVSSGSLPQQALGRYGIERRATLGVLDIAVTRGGRGIGRPVRASVAATSENLLGQDEPIELRVVTANERVSYLGTFEFEPGRLRRFVVTVQPIGSPVVYTQRFEERLFAIQR